MLASPRALAAWALVAYTAAGLVFAFLLWITPGDGSYLRHFSNAGFRDLVLMVMPVLGVLLATKAGPPVAGARLITVLALAEYAISLALGALTLVVGVFPVMGDISSARSAIAALEYVVLGIGAELLIAVAAWGVARIFMEQGGTLPQIRITTSPSRH
jgi:hypothetical protein